MSVDSVEVRLSAIDEERFGIRTARASQVTLATLPIVLDFCRANHVKFLIARCLDSELAAAQAMEQKGFILMDTLIYYARSLKKMPIPPDTGEIPVRSIRPGDEEQVKIVAARAFHGYFGHYHADPRLDRTKCDEVYISWAVRSCISREVADEVLVADDGRSILGFATLRINSPEEGEGVLFGVDPLALSEHVRFLKRQSGQGVLFGVDPLAHGRGIYRSFVIRSMEWFLGRGCTRQVMSTQITNIAVQKVWVRLGFEPSHAYYTFHKWFD